MAHYPFIILLNVNPFPNKRWLLRVSCTSLLKTLGEKEKALVTSNFSFFPPVFSTLLDNFLQFSSIVVFRLFQFGRTYNLSFGKGLNDRKNHCDEKKSILWYWYFFHLSIASLHNDTNQKTQGENHFDGGKRRFIFEDGRFRYYNHLAHLEWPIPRLYIA